MCITLRTYYLSTFQLLDIYKAKLHRTQERKDNKTNQKTSSLSYTHLMSTMIYICFLSAPALYHASNFRNGYNPSIRTGMSEVSLSPSYIHYMQSTQTLSFAAFKTLQEGREHTVTLEIPCVFHNIVAFYLGRLLWQKGPNLCGWLGLTQFEEPYDMQIKHWAGRGTTTGYHGARREEDYTVFIRWGGEGRNHVSLQVCCSD